MAEEPTGKLIDEWKQGNVRVRIFDGVYADKSQEELQKNMKKLDRTCWSCIRACGKNKNTQPI